MWSVLGDKMKRWNPGKYLQITIVALAASGSLGAARAGADPLILRIGATQPIDSLNPFVSQSDYSLVIYEYIYPHLVQYDQDLKFVPYFATDWQTSSDGLKWIFHTVPGATWSDGTPLTARDVVFTLNMIMQYQNGPTGQLAGLVAHLNKAEAPDDNTVVLTYAQPVANVLAQMQAVPILPKKVWSSLATGNGTGITTFNNTPPEISGGPFILTKAVPNQSALLVANPRWWGSVKPKIQAVGFQFYANDDAMVMAILSHQIDLAGEQIPPTAVATLKQAGVSVETMPSVSFKTFIINTNPSKKNNRELLDPRVREAFEYATDRDAIIRTAWLGLATAGSTIVAPVTGWHDDSIQPLPFDPGKANQILDSLGYKKQPNGIRLANGHPMAYDVVFPTEENGTGDRTFQILQNDFTQIGVSIIQRKMDPTAATTAIQGTDGRYTDFDLAMWNWTPVVDPDFVLSVMTCAALGNNSDSGYCDHGYDQMYQAQSTMLDPAQRHLEVDKMQEKIYTDRPYIVLDYPDVIEAHSKDWTGFVLSPLIGSVNNLSTQTLLAVTKSASP